MCTDKYTTFSCTHVVHERNFCPAFRTWQKRNRNAEFESCRAYNRVDENSDRKCMRAGKGFCVKPGMNFDVNGMQIKGKEEDLTDMSETMAVDEKAAESKDDGTLQDLKNEMSVDKPEKAVENENIVHNVLQKVLEKKLEVGNDDPQANLKKSRWRLDHGSDLSFSQRIGDSARCYDFLTNFFRGICPCSCT
ncbi:hypothetical protein BDZ45DRAFT_802197 [Acephala macrosclerotiorum]|nr:hypothetical protein BDZ45DRAFT_802197 [Acephala macrosclerotiorum]